jgi:Flp pilus assembly protein TadD
MKLYQNEARQHLERALELDPDFVAAKLHLVDSVMSEDRERGERMWDEALAADVSELTPRERFIVERSRAYREERRDDAAKLIEEYLDRFPDDTYVLNAKAMRAWRMGDFEDAERLYRRLVEISPNWIIAYNQLGYITMSQGRFAEAEEYFTSYRFVAPDQANPHDSLGELYTILGRYDEALGSLERAIEIKADFWNSYDHLALVRTLMADYAAAEEVVANAESAENCPEYWTGGLRCLLHYAQLVDSEQWQQIAAERESTCLDGHSGGYVATMTHRAACVLGQWDVAGAIEDTTAGYLAEVGDSAQRKDVAALSAMLAHMEGVRHAVNEDLEAAEQSFLVADRHLSYIAAGTGMYKLYNRMLLVETLFAAGRDGDAHQLLSKVRSVNPNLVRNFEDAGLSLLGLE